MVESWWAVGDEAAEALALIDGAATDSRMAGHADAEPNQGHPKLLCRLYVNRELCSVQAAACGVLMDGEMSVRLRSRIIRR